VKPTLAFIGAGQVANALALYFYRRGYDIVGIYSRSTESAVKLAERVDSVVASPYPAADIIFLTIPDDALAEVVDKLVQQKPSGALVHTSGVHSVGILASLMPSEVGSFHPLYPFRDGTELNGTENMLIAIESSHQQLKQRLIALANELGGRPTVLKLGHKVRYHVGAVIASNYLVTLFDIGLNLMVDAGVSIDDAQQALVSLMQGNLDNLKYRRTAASLTGPIVRGDVVTIEKHLLALVGTDYTKIYRELGKLTAKLAPDLSADVLQDLLDLLENE